MNSLTFRVFTSDDYGLLRSLMHGLYSNDQNEKVMSDLNITQTLNHLQNFPDVGTIILIEYFREVIGYALLINFWSNEYGGNMLIIDELYILPNHRNKGLGTSFIDFLKKTKYNNSVAIELEVLPYNVKALEWYKKLGFQISDRTFMTMDLS